MLSRVADSLYWMGRYIERAEHSSRIIAVKLESMVEQSREESESSWLRIADALGEEFAPGGDALANTQLLAFDRKNPSSLFSSIAAARDNARQVREQLSTEVWEHLNRLYLRLQPVNAETIRVHHPARIFREVMSDLNSLEGVTYSTLSHGEGWYFLELGRHIERAQSVGRLLELYYGKPHTHTLTPPKYFDWLVLLKFCTAFEPYCKEYTAAILPERIAEFLLFNEEFPHSVRYAVNRIVESLIKVAPAAPPARRASVERLAGKLKATMDFGQIDDLLNGQLATFVVDITKQCEQVHEAVFASYIAYGAETVL